MDPNPKGVSMNDINLKFKTLLDGLSYELLLLRSKLELYKFIQDKRFEKHKIFEMSPCFFSLILDSLIIEIIVTISKIYEKSSRSDINIYSFLNFIEQNKKTIEIHPKHKADNKYIDNNLINYQRQEIEKKKNIIDNIITWRDKNYAHFDYKYFNKTEELAKDFPLNIPELRNLIQLSCGIINVYLLFVYNKTNDYVSVNNYDFENILNQIK